MTRLLLVLAAAALFQTLLVGCHKVENTTPRYDKNACLVCNRFGYESEAGKCSFCRGSTVCQFCQGKGKRLEGKKDRYYETVCAFCGGTGKCHYCKGSGKCGICKGTGKYTPLAPDSLDSPGGQ